MKTIKASEAKELANKYHHNQTEVTHKLIKTHLVKVFNSEIKRCSKLGLSDINIFTMIDEFQGIAALKEKLKINRPLVDEAIKKLALDNEYKVQNGIIYW